MPSTEPGRPSSGRRSLVRRVGLVAALTAAGASLATLSVAMVVVDYRVTSDAEDDALERARALAAELDAEARAQQAVTQAQLEDELREFSHGDVTLAVWEASGRLAGDPALPSPAQDGCEASAGPDGAWMVCRASSASAGRWVLVGEPRSQLLAHREPLLLGGLVALIVVVLGGIFAGISVGRWSLRPLVRLQGALTAMDAAAPQPAPSLPRSGMVEIDDVAATIDDLLGRLRVELERSRHFAADAAHELRTPLTKLRTELELRAEEHDEGSHEGRQLLRSVARVEDLGELVDHLLVLASPESALRGASLVSVSALVEAVVEDLDADASRVRLELEDDGAVVGDATVLSAAISNGLGNALKYSKGPVRVGVQDTAEHVVLRIDDEGPGLGEEARARAFEPFYRAPEQRGTGGHGIGLALIAHVVAAHRGDAAFVDDGPGAHLVVRLPRHRGVRPEQT